MNSEAVVLSEPNAEVKRFSPEAKLALKKEGYMIYGLTGISLRKMSETLEKRYKFPSVWFKTQPLGDVPSIISEVAIKQEQPFLQESSGKSLNEQQAMIEKFSEELSKRIPGVRAVIGTVADYAEIAFAYQGRKETKGESLVGKNEIIRTVSETDAGSVAGVGIYDGVFGLIVSDCSKAGTDRRIGVVPMIVPA